MILTKADFKIIRDLEKIAEDVVPVNSAKIAAAIVDGTRIIAYGVNQKKTDTFQAKYCSNPHAIYLHAETAAIKKAINRLRTKDLSDLTLFVVRRKRFIGLKNYFVSGNAYPCDGCKRAIKDYGIGSLIYSNDYDYFKEVFV